MHLDDLATDDVTPGQEYSDFLESFVKDQEDLLTVIKILKCRFTFYDIEDYFEKLKPHMERLKLGKVSKILKTSHVFCNSINCDLYTPSFLCNWTRNNPELFETEIVFFTKFLNYFTDFLEMDVSAYPISELYTGEDVPVSGQTVKERLKVLNSVLKHYDCIARIFP
jgi:hypothetical protein